MPEGHTIHGLAQRLNRAFAGRDVCVESPQGRFATEATLLDGARFVSAHAVGKHLYLEFDADRWVHVHLGLIGNFAVLTGPAPVNPVEGTVRLRIHDGSHTADLRGPQTCKLVGPDSLGLTLATLGPDPLRQDADPVRAWSRISRSRQSIAALLMDQEVVAGIGNVYRCEVLFRHRLDPFSPGQGLLCTTWKALWDDLVRMMRVGAVLNQIITIEEDLTAAERELDDADIRAYAEHLTGRRLGDRYPRRFALYQRTGQPCLRCSTLVRQQKHHGRELYWCPGCQMRCT